VLVVVTTALATDTDLERIARLRSTFPTVMVVVVDETARDGVMSRGGTRRPVLGPVVPIRVTAGRPFATAWAEALGRNRPMTVTLGGRR
jgi:hypothetical protein